MRVILMAAAVLFAVSCREIANPQVRGGTPPATSETVTLQVGDRVVIDGIELAFVRVVSDKRCPKDVLCFWEGNAAVQLSVGPVLGEGPAYPLVLNTALDPREADVWGLHVAILELRPERLSTAPIDPNAYVVVLKVKRDRIVGGRGHPARRVVRARIPG